MVTSDLPVLFLHGSKKMRPTFGWCQFSSLCLLLLPQGPEGCYFTVSITGLSIARLELAWLFQAKLSPPCEAPQFSSRSCKVPGLMCNFLFPPHLLKLLCYHLLGRGHQFHQMEMCLVMEGIFSKGWRFLGGVYGETTCFIRRTWFLSPSQHKAAHAPHHVHY